MRALRKIASSFVGSRAIYVPQTIKLDIVNKKEPKLFTSFRKTPVIQLVAVSKDANKLHVPLFYGLCMQVGAGRTPREKVLELQLDEQVFSSLSEAQKRFVKSVWGTTNSVLRNHIEGLSEVCNFL
jgi:hypothetical protein